VKTNIILLDCFCKIKIRFKFYYCNTYFGVQILKTTFKKKIDAGKNIMNNELVNSNKQSPTGSLV